MDTIDLGQDGPPIANEDMNIIIAVVRNLSEQKKAFRINLPYGAYLTNQGEGPIISFSGIDQIAKAHSALMEASGHNQFTLTMPTEDFKQRTRIGVLFGMEVYADPLCNKNNFVIKEKEKAS